MDFSCFFFVIISVSEININILTKEIDIEVECKTNFWFAFPVLILQDKINLDSEKIMEIAEFRIDG